MLRIRAVKTLLVEEVGGIVLPRPPEDGDAPWSAEDEREIVREELGRAIRKATLTVTLCWVAVAVLLATHENPSRFLSFEGLEAVFTLGVLLVAAYSGFRLGQWEKYRAVRRAVEELEEREGE